MANDRIRAVIWDMDGVIVDTGPYHYRAWRQVFGERGIEFTESEFQTHFGQRNDTIIRSALGQKTTLEDIKTIACQKEEIFRKIARENLRALPGAVELIKSLREHDFKIGLASSAPYENIWLVLEGLRIKEYFDAIVSGHEVTEGKPSPQAFLLAASKLGVAPAGCVVVEDAVAGVAGCKRAGMRCLAVTNTNRASELAEADLIVDTLQVITVKDIERLIGGE